MRRVSWCRGLVLICCLIVPLTHSQTPDVKSELNLGIASYEKGTYEEAIQHLEHVVSIDPEATIGHFYLALAYDQMCASPNPCDPRRSGRAIQEYSRVLELDPAHKDALKSMAHLLYRIARFDEAEGFYRKAAKLDANDPEALYSIAVLDFRRTYPVLMQEKARLHLARKQPLIGFRTCHQVRAKNLADVEEGIALLTRTVELVNNVDVQTYLAVFYMERAELHCGDRLAYERDLKSESQWWDRACATWHDPKRSYPPRWIAGQPPPPPKRGDKCRW